MLAESNIGRPFLGLMGIPLESRLFLVLLISTVAIAASGIVRSPRV